MCGTEKDFDRQRLLQLIDRRCNGAIAEVEVRELESILDSSPSARREYWAAMMTHADLEWELSSTENWAAAVERILGNVHPSESALEVQIHEENLAKPRSIDLERTTTRGLGLLAIAACLLMGAFIGTWSAWKGNESGTTDVAISPPNGLSSRDSTIIGKLAPLSHGSRWSFGRASDHSLSNVSLGDTLSIDVGGVEMVLSNDVVAQMKAPAVLQLVSVDQLRLLHGRIQVDVPEGAEGFSVDTATAEIVDLGTSFSVEVANGGTDLIVHDGEVDLKVPDDIPKPNQHKPEVRRFRGGEAVHVAHDGTLSRIVNVHSDVIASADLAVPREPLILSVQDNLSRDNLWSFYEIVPNGFGEDTLAFVDRHHEWNGANKAGLPSYLVGADYVKTFNNDKVTSEVNIDLELRGPATVFVFLDRRLTPPDWLIETFSETGDIVGIDEEHPPENLNLTGPGNSIDNVFAVWKYEAKTGGVVQLGQNGVPQMKAGLNVKLIRSNMYGIAVAELQE